MPSSVKIRRLSGLNREGPPGESGRLLVLIGLAEPGAAFGFDGRNRSRGRSFKGPGRCIEVDSEKKEKEDAKRTMRVRFNFSNLNNAVSAWFVTVALRNASHKNNYT